MRKNHMLSKLSLMALLLMPLSAAPGSAASGFRSGVPVEAVIMRAGAAASKISHIRSVPSVGVVNLKRFAPRLLRDDYDYSDYKVSVEKNYAGVQRLRNALKSNPSTRRALAAHGIAISRVVAADVYSNGSIKVYVF